jgi:tetratricopeptide (TPR) repeat protein
VIGRLAAARVIVEQAVACDPQDLGIRRRLETLPKTTQAVAQCEFGLALLAAGLVSEAEAELQAALSAEPNDRDVLNALGGLYRDTGNPERAIEIYRRAATYHPRDAHIQTGLSAALAMAGQYDDALDGLDGAIALKPDLAEAHKHRAKILLELGRTEEALAASDTARALLPDYPEAEFARAAALLRLGRYAEGWEAYESRHRLPRNVNARSALPTWHGEPLDGAALHVIGEQGVGDTIMFGTCLADLEHCDAQISLHCQPRLVSLMARAFPWIDVTPRLPETTTANFAVPLGSLPRLLRRREAAFLGGAPYLRAERSAIERCRDEFVKRGPGPVVGISWRGGAGLLEQTKRTTQLMEWLPLLQIDGIRFIDLQHGEHEGERAAVRSRLDDVLYRPDGPDPINDLETVAARVAALDLVISVDNTTVHFAGALGVPVWTLLPSAPSWRWQENRSDTPWYPSMHLVRQGSGEPWSAVLARTAAKLEEFVTGNKAGTQKNETEQVDTQVEGDPPMPVTDQARPFEDRSIGIHSLAGK